MATCRSGHVGGDGVPCSRRAMSMAHSIQLRIEPNRMKRNHIIALVLLAGCMAFAAQGDDARGSQGVSANTAAKPAECSGV